MNDMTATPDAEASSLETDVIIVGAGPVGLFAVFELGLLDLKCHLVDILDRPGGQCTELYPEKPIYDIPGIPMLTGQELTDRLLQQIKPFHAQFHFNEMAAALTRLADGRWQLSTDAGTDRARRGDRGGWRQLPRRPPVAGIEAYEGKSVFLPCAGRTAGRDVRRWGRDSALDWTLNLADASRLTLVHHRDGFRAQPASIACGW
jgi:thioredoxin reductase (NADPH)